MSQRVLYNKLYEEEYFNKKLCVYLNAGIGIPCAGHVRAIPDPNSFLKADESTIDENFGLASPIGSSKTKRSKKH